MKQKKYNKMIIDTPKGQYELPLEVVATDRAQYYAGDQGFEEGTPEWDMELDAVYYDDYEGIDWFINNMDWDEVKDRAKKINDKVKVTDDDFLTSTDNIKLL